MTQIEFDFSVKQQYKPLRGFALKLTGDHENANDLVQETMLRALIYKEKFQEGTNLKGWLYTIMRNIFINNYRRMVKGNIFTDNSENQFYINSAHHAVNNEGEGRLIMREIKEAINNLSESLKTPFLMTCDGYKYEEIAAHLAVPLGTVKIRIHTARQKLKAKLHPYGIKFGFSLN